MTVPNTTILSGPYLGNGVADTFEFAFTVMEASEVLVVMTDDDGVETTLELTTDYTVDVSGKTITLVAGPLPVDYLLIIKSQIVPLQLTNFSSQGAFYPEIHEAAFDKLTRVVQQHQEEAGRSLRVTPTVGTHVDTILPTPAARRALIWNEDGDALTLTDNDPDAMVNEAAASAVEAAASELAAGISEVNAAASELAAGTSENNAAASEAKAQQWAEEDQGVEVETGQYSAKHWALSAEEVTAGKEPGLGNPDEDGKVLTSTAAGVRSWVGMIPGVPTGAVLPFAQNSAPAGWLKCNGAAVSRATYATLFSAIGETYGAGDGSTTFLLPDLRGEFVRGWDDARGIDAARAIGSTQADDFKAHNHDIPVGYGGSWTNTRLRRQEATSNTGTFTSMANTGGTETRPRNVALLYCIKF